MSISSSVREQLLNNFRAELQEHIQTITNGLLALEQQTVSGEERKLCLDDVFRAAHSMKGAARAVGVTMIEQLAHALESLLDMLRKARLTPSPEFFTTCYHALDTIQQVQKAYEVGQLTPPAKAVQTLVTLQQLATETRREPVSEEPAEAVYCPINASPSRGAEVFDDTIRVKVTKLDTLMAQLSELMVTKIRAEQRLSQLREIEERIGSWQREWLGVRSVCSRLSRKRNGAASSPDWDLLLQHAWGNQDQLREVSTMVGDLSRAYANDTMHMALVINELEEEIKRVRMLPLATITGSFGRMVRDLAHAAGKEAILRIVGGDTELDKRFLEELKDPLIHLLRNAVDHGIEPPDEREAAGKHRQGIVTLAAEQLGNDIVITVSDDGAGLDLEAVRRAVAEHHPETAEGMNAEELKQAIFNEGISTTATITDISGRGMGLSVVRRNLEELRGRIVVDWEPGAGTTFTLKLPLTLSSSRGLLLHVAGERFAVPLNNVERIVAVTPEQIATLGGAPALRYRETTIPLVRLEEVLELVPVEGERPSGESPAVILSVAERRVAFLVDRLAGEQEIVMKGLGKQLSRVGGIAGATVMGSGEIVLILNVADVVRMALRERAFARASAPASKAGAELATRDKSAAHLAQGYILIVDDSITTRTLEKNILEAAGYRVRLATDGQEAWELMTANDLPKLVVSDVSMPRLDGIELTRRIKSTGRTTQTPVILVTSLDSPQDKARGIDAGANAYITKGAFDQDDLLETIEQLI